MCCLVTVRNEVAKVMFLHVSVILFTGGCYPSMHCRWYPSMPCNRGCAIPACIAGGIPACLAVGGAIPACLAAGGLLPGGCLLWGVWRPPGSRQLLLWMVRILLECILVFIFFEINFIFRMLVFC